jgi:thiol-disulfide isomerase/thioredoxin
MKRFAAIGVLLVIAVSACGSKSPPAIHVNGQPTEGSGASPRLIHEARLAHCPTSSATAVSGGLPDVTLPCLGAGPAVHMAGLTGAPTVVNLWGSWCEPCQAEEKYLSSAYDATSGKVRFLGVDTVDDADSALDFDAHVTPPVHFPSVFDPDKKVLLDLHFTGPPESLYLNAAGKVVHINRVPYASTAAVMADISRYLHVR